LKGTYGPLNTQKPKQESNTGVPPARLVNNAVRAKNIIGRVHFGTGGSCEEDDYDDWRHAFWFGRGSSRGNGVSLVRREGRQNTAQPKKVSWIDARKVAPRLMNTKELVKRAR